MSFVAAILLAISLMFLWLKGRSIASARNDPSQFDPAYDKHIRDILDDP